MTIEECFKKHCVTVNFEILSLYRWGDVTIFFVNPNNNDTENVSFNIAFPLSDVGLKQLEKLYKEFCKDEGIPYNTVEEIRLERVAETYNALIHNYTWSDICKKAEDTGYGDPRLTAKDNARYAVQQLVLEEKGINIEDAEIPEEEVSYYTDLWHIRFDGNGSIAKYKIKEEE